MVRNGFHDDLAALTENRTKLPLGEIYEQTFRNSSSSVPLITRRLYEYEITDRERAVEGASGRSSETARRNGESGGSSEYGEQ